MSLTNKVALVTGAGTGIGRGIAIELAARGAHVAVHYNRSDAGALETQQQIEALGGRSFLVQADVSAQDQINRMVSQTAGHYGQIDILINNAALQLNYSLFDYGEAAY